MIYKYAIKKTKIFIYHSNIYLIWISKIENWLQDVCLSWTSGVASLHQQAHVLFLCNKIKPDHLANRKGVELWGVVRKLSTSALTTSFATFFVCSSLTRFHVWYMLFTYLMFFICKLLCFTQVFAVFVNWNDVHQFSKMSLPLTKYLFLLNIFRFH